MIAFGYTGDFRKATLETHYSGMEMKFGTQAKNLLENVCCKSQVENEKLQFETYGQFLLSHPV